MHQFNKVLTFSSNQKWLILFFNLFGLGLRLGFAHKKKNKTIILKSFSVSVRKKLQTIRMFKKVMRLRRIKSSPTMQSANWEWLWTEDEVETNSESKKTESKDRGIEEDEPSKIRERSEWKRKTESEEDGASERGRQSERKRKTESEEQDIAMERDRDSNRDKERHITPAKEKESRKSCWMMVWVCL